jgi:hypothetical protein
MSVRDIAHHRHGPNKQQAVAFNRSAGGTRLPIHCECDDFIMLNGHSCETEHDTEMMHANSKRSGCFMQAGMCGLFLQLR